jgi:plastocyanin
MRGSAIALVAAIGGCLLAPAAPLADEPPAPPTAALTTAHTTFPAGQTITLDSSASRPGAAAIVGHVWDLDGDGSFETDTGSKATVDTTPLHPGPMTVHVRVVDDHGLASDAQLDLNVTAPPSPADDPTVDKSSVSGIAKQPAPAATPLTQSTPTPAAAPAPAPAPQPAAATPAPAPAPAPATTTVPATVRMTAAPVLLPRKTLASTQKASAPAKTTVSAAAATGVTIKNFAFSPATSSVHVGDTITWSNNDVAPHTATASDHSFDTGTINKGKSASHTFTKAGTFAYICSIHPSMHGTITVAAVSTTGSNSGGTGSGGTGSGSTPSTTPTPSSSASKSSLPQTGLDIAAVVLLAMLMTGSGTLLRRRVSP